MKLIIDGHERDWIYKEDLTLHEVMMDVQSRLLEEERVICEIKLEETVPDLDMTLTPDKVTIDNIVAVSFQTTPYKDALIESLESSLEKLRDVKGSIGSIVELIIADKIDTAMNKLKEGLDIMIWFFDILHQITVNNIVNIGEVEIGDKKLIAYIEKFNEMLNELVTAMKNNDMTLINDYLEYELEPALNDLTGALPKMISEAKGE